LRSFANGRSNAAGAGISGTGIAESAGEKTGIEPISSPRWSRIAVFQVPSTGSGGVR
jgi:hypothetical protein